jgi:hypothetical protein
MSQGNIAFEMQNGEFPTSTATPTKVVNVTDATYGTVCMLGYVTPASAVSTENVGSGFGVGCLLMDITNGKLYKNVGTTETASFTEITS